MTRRLASRSQAGFTLIEALVSVLFVAIAVLSLAGGLLTVVRSQSRTDQRQRLQLAASNYAESLKGLQYIDCGTAALYRAEPDLWVPPTGVTVGIDKVEYWVKKAVPAGPTGNENSLYTGGYTASCPAQDEGAQRITIRATIQGQARQAQIVKTDR